MTTILVKAGCLPGLEVVVSVSGGNSGDEGKKAMYAISNKQLSELISKVTKTSKKIPVLCSNDKCFYPFSIFG